MQVLQQVTIPVWPLEDNTVLENVSVTYQQFGLAIGTAPVVLVNHSLNGDSDCAYHWDGIMGENKAIDLKEYTVICIDIPGNGISQEIKYDYLPLDKISARDVAVLFWLTLFELEINELFAAIGVDLGGGIAWEMACVFPKRILNLIPIASSPRTEAWLLRAPDAKSNYLQSIFYSVDIARNRKSLLEVAQFIQSKIHIIYVKKEEYFSKTELRKFYTQLQQLHKSVEFYELETVVDRQSLQDNIVEVEKVVDGILEKEYVTKVA